MKDGEAAMNPDQPPQVQGPTTSSSAAEPPAEESTVGSSSPDRAQIPQQELPALTSVLTCSNQKNQRCKTQTYYVIGTAHVSQESCDRVERLIRMVEPDAIMLELCSLRTGLLEPRDSSKVMTISDLLESLRSGKKRLFEVLYSWFLSRMGEQFEVAPGSEFSVAFQLARSAYPPIRVVLGDRRSDVTVGRMWSSLSLWQRAQLLWAFLSAGVMLPIEELKEMLSRMHETDFLTEAIRELGKTCPSLIDTLIDERDRYMVAALRTMAPSHCTVVAVVGAGHLPGIRRHWDSPPSAEELQQLCVVPEPSFAVRFTATALRCTVGFAAVGTAAALLLVLSSRTARLYSACTRSAHALVH